MEATALSVGKSVLDGALGYAKSTVAEEVALQLGVQRDHAFIRDELAMMQAFLRAAHGERDDHEVLMAWVKQVRDVAYDAEDCLQDFSIHLHKPSWWRLPSTLRERRRIAKKMKELRARVEDVSKRNLRYQLIKSAGSKPETAAELSSITAAAIFGIDDARRAAKDDRPKEDLVDLINKEGEDLRVIAVWGTSGDLGQTSIINAAYENPDIKKKFACRAWIRILNPFNPNDFIQSLVKQFQSTMGVSALLETEKIGQEFAEEFTGYINEQSYLIVLNGLSTFEEWNRIRSCFTNNKKGSRIIVCSPQVEVASLCAGLESQALELKQYSADQTIYAFYEKDYQDQTKLLVSASSSYETTGNANGISRNQSRVIDDARRAEKDDNSKVDLVHLIDQEGEDLRVIAVWGTSCDLGQESIINEAYENPDIKKKFSCRAWVRVLHPFNLNNFIQSLVTQFRSALGVGILLETETTGQVLAEEFTRYVNEESYLIVLSDLSTFEEWNGIKACFPNNKKGSRIIVSTPQAEVARLCPGQESQVLELKHLSTDQTIYAFCEKDKTNSPMPMSTINSVAPTNEIAENQSDGGNQRKEATKCLSRIKTMINASKDSQPIGREKEVSDVIKLILNKLGQEFLVISVWGMGGIGKTTLVKDIYQNKNLIGMFDKRVSITVMRPFILKELLKSLIVQISTESSEKKGAMVDLGGGTRKRLAMMELKELIEELVRLLQGSKCLIVLDDLSSTAEWDMIKQSFPKMKNTSRIIVTTREGSIAKHCSGKQENIYNLKVLEDKDAQNLFTRKVFHKATALDTYPELIQEAKMILKKCKGLPLAIVTIGGFLANQPKVAVEWRKLNEHISAELEMNPELGAIKTILAKSYDGLPYHLKSCFLYTSIFPEDHKVGRRRLIRRWSAEGYSREIRDKSPEEVADNYFMELIERSMILPSQLSVNSRKRIDSCQVHDLMREISISKSTEENLVFRMEEGCSSNALSTVRHLVISTNWEGDKNEFESAVDLSRVRSLTVFGKWRPFFISDKMRLLRVLDLEGTSGLVDHHLEHIGKLLHLRYLSVRGCYDIWHLPADSLGNLENLETLDISGTRILKLPKTITKLRKLQYLHAGGVETNDEDAYKHITEDIPKALRNKSCFLTMCLLGFCAACCAPHLLKEFHETDGDVNRGDVCTYCCCAILPFVTTNKIPVHMPRGIGKLKALRTLGLVNLAWDKAILQDIKRLTQLRKLAVTGISKKNGQEFGSVVANLSCLESLLVQSRGMPGLCDCLDDISSPPKNLQSLKLYGNLVRLPGWVEGLQNLVKLKLRSSRILAYDAAMQVLGKLPNLVSLLLWAKSFQGEDLRFTFHPEAFLSLTVLELNDIDGLKSVEFEEEAMLQLERLDFRGSFEETNTGLFSGLPLLPSLKEFMLDDKTYKDDFMKDLQGQLAKNQKGPVLKRWR